ncbi:uncharacterized protein LOC142221920 [Haematobia irritans]|uniref:uncharacterized protein LOC142221920 n=1 Tax=Haematobia irritans TaxID=7368 RepID=UPI003F509C74
MCCLFSLLCQHRQRKFAYCNRCSSASATIKVCLFFGALFLNLSPASFYSGNHSESYLSKSRSDELQRIAQLLGDSIDADKNPCESYFDYVCGRNRPLFSVMGHLPDADDLRNLLTSLQEDNEPFEAKQKLIDFFISCNTRHSLDDCYLQTFEYFKPIFGFIISKKHLQNTPEELTMFLHILDRFVKQAGEQNWKFKSGHTLARLTSLKNSFKYPQTYFRSGALDKEYEPLRVYRESYQHNLKNLDIYLRRNSTFMQGTHKIALDWTLYLYQSRNKPIPYYFSTLSPHLWMSVYNRSDIREYEPQRITEISECLKLPQFVNVLEEARNMTIIYIKSFRSAWSDYKDWTSTRANAAIAAEESEVLSKHKLSSDKLFFILYAQNFCQLGRDLAESVFYVGMTHNVQFTRAYSCIYPTGRNYECV